MRGLFALIVAVATSLLPISIAISAAMPARTAIPERTIPAGPTQATFPDCPAPGINAVTARHQAGSLHIHVVVQNLGNRTFLAGRDDAMLEVSLGDEVLARHSLGNLFAGEVRHFSNGQALDGAEARKPITARLVYSGAANQRDCRLSDNVMTRDGATLF